MALQDQINKLREDILAKGNDPVPATYQGVTKGRISDVLREIDCLTTDQRDAVFALLDDVSPSFYSIQYKNFPAGIRFCDAEKGTDLFLPIQTSLSQNSFRESQNRIRVFTWDTELHQGKIVRKLQTALGKIE